MPCLFFPGSGPIFYTSDPDTIQQIVTSKSIVKPLDMYKVLSFFGQNVVIVEGQEHRRHRKVVAPAFSESNNDFVWQSSVNTCRAWFKDVDSKLILNKDGKSRSVVDDDVVLSTMRAALIIISAAAFGVEIPWQDAHLKPPAGHKLIFRQAIQDVLSYTIPRVLAPKWLYNVSFLPEKLKTSLDNTETAYTELETYLSEFVAERRAGKGGDQQRKDLMSLLLAQSSDTGTGSLSVREVKGNIYIFLLAGHETTAHTLAFALNLLALYPEEQDKLYQEAKEVFVDGTEPTYSDFTKLVRSLAIFHETLRLFPPVPNVPKRAAEDMVLYAHTTDDDQKRIPVPIPQGSDIMIDAKGLHFNPQIWDQPYQFKPDRFIDTDSYRWRRDAFVPFSIGSRSCVGQKFAQVEGACILAMIAKNYRISLHPDDRAAYDAGEETFEQLRDRVLALKYQITLTPTHTRVVFTKRE